LPADQRSLALPQPSTGRPGSTKLDLAATLRYYGGSASGGSLGPATDRIRHATSAHPQAGFLRVDVEHLPFAAHSLDAVCSCGLLQYVDRAQIIEFCLHVLRPGHRPYSSQISPARLYRHDHRLLG